MNTITNQGFNQMITQQGGTSLMADGIAAQAKAMIESRYIMAMQRPRNWDDVRQRILKECSRPSFANNKSALYIKPIGQGIEGLGIRFAEMAIRCMTNVVVEISTIYDDETKEVIRVSVTDLEANISYPMDIKISKTVERSRPMDDGTYISMRMNSYNKPVYTIPASDDELINKRNSAISKAMRTNGMRLIPGDITDEAISIIKKIRLDESAKDPDENRRNIINMFSTIGISAADLVKYLGHGIDSCSPAEMSTLRGIYGTVSDGEITWHEIMSEKELSSDEDEGMTKLSQAIKNRAAKKKAEKADKTNKKYTNQEDLISQPDQMFSYAEIADKINKANSEDDIDEALSLISGLPEGQKKELISLAASAKEKISGDNCYAQSCT